MITADSVLSFVATCFIIELTPGPNMAYLAVLSLGNGRRAAFSAVAGVALGLLIVGIFGSLGLSTFISSSNLAFLILKWAGVAYLLGLGWDGWQSSNETSPGKAKTGETQISFFTRGLITNILNPKALVFYVAILPGFIDGAGPIIYQTLTLTVIYVAIATSIHSMIVLLAGMAHGFLNNPVRNLMTRRAMSVLLLLIAGWLAWTTGEHMH